MPTILPPTISADLDLQSRSPVPSLDILSYKLPNCSTTGPHGIKRAPTHQLVPVDNCTVIGKTLSFRLSPPTPCPDGYVPFVIIYHFSNCTGEGVAEAYFSPIDDTCVADDAVGRSALFQCTDS